MNTPAPSAQAALPHLKLATFPELVALAASKRDLQIKTAIEGDMRLVRMEDGRLEIALERSAARSLVNELSRKLEQWTGKRWTVIVSNEQGQPTLREQSKAKKDQLTVGVHADPRVQAVLSKFPGAQVIDVRRLSHDDAPGEVTEPLDVSDDDL